MLIGILSDSHDSTVAMAAAVRLLRDGGAEFLVHCGDVGSQMMLDHLAGIPAAFVWGNCDWDRMGLQRYAAELGIACYGAFGDLTLGGKKIALLHGDDAARKAQVLAEQRHDYLLCGHTHVADDRRVGKTRVINPGALFRTNRKSVAILDTATDELRSIAVEV